jgi:DGQHR domain-containing protein
MLQSELLLLGKSNDDGSYSVRVPAGLLIESAFVDFYNDRNGTGYQRNETLRERRGREIAEYIARCAQSGLRPRLFELTANARLEPDDFSFDPLDEHGTVGWVRLKIGDERWLSLIDGGTRLLGIEKALVRKVLDDGHGVDVRLFAGLSTPEEIAMFLLVNEKQKRVRTDLSVRVVQRYLDDGNLTDQQLQILRTVVPDEDQWRYDASRIAGRLNTDTDSPWKGLIQMPGDQVTRPIKLQAFWTSLNGLLTDKDLKSLLESLEGQGLLKSSTGQSVDSTEFLIRVLKNFWSAVADANPAAYTEPSTNVLWGSIGVSGCHGGLASIIVTVLTGPNPNLSKDRFLDMIKESDVPDYGFWFSRRGSLQGDYPGEKGEGTTMTGGSGYARLAERLERDWRAALHQQPAAATIQV